MHKRTLVALALAVLTMPVWAQDKPATDEKKLTFKMKDASVDAVLQYVSSVTGWIFVQEKATSGTVSAVSDTDVPLSKVLDFPQFRAASARPRDPESLLPRAAHRRPDPQGHRHLGRHEARL
jgi:hypothetical protein